MRTVGASVQYRLPYTTRAYAREKLEQSGGFSEIAKGYAVYQGDLLERRQSAWDRQTVEADFTNDSRTIDDARSAP